MTFDEIKKEAEALAPHDKLILAQIMLQMAIREQENKDSAEAHVSYNIDEIKHSLTKLNPKNLKSLKNCIKTQFNFKGGISDEDIDSIIKKLKKEKFLRIDEKNSVVML